MKTVLNKGFTLIEMSITMLILAFITGGVLIGKDIIYNAQIRATVKQTEMFSLAYSTFRLKYNCLPGDCTNATSLGFSANFSIQLSQADIHNPGLMNHINPISSAFAAVIPDISIGVNTLYVPSSSGSLTPGFAPVPPTAVPLNGNGNSQIENDIPYSAEGSTGQAMVAQALPGVLRDFRIDQTRVYLALSSAGSSIDNIYKPAFWAVASLAPAANSLIDKAGIYLMPIGSFLPFSAAAIPTFAAWSIDIKTDDGKPISGVTRGSSAPAVDLENGPPYIDVRDVGAGKCLTQATNGSIVYNIMNTSMDARCAMVINLGV